MLIDATTTLLMDLADNVVSKASQSADVANKSGRDFLFTFMGFEWSMPAPDIIFLVFLLLFFLAYGFTFGRDRIAATLISIYLSLGLATNLPYLQKLNDFLSSWGVPTFKISAFLLIFFVLFVLLSRSSLLRGLGEGLNAWWQVILFSLLQAGLLATVVISFLPGEFVKSLSPFSHMIFAGDLAKFCWILFPILTLVFLSGRRSRFRY